MRKAIVIVLDSVRQDHVGCYGYPRNTTPNIDKLAGQGTVLDGYIPEPMMPGTVAAAYSFLSGQDEQTLRVAECPQDIELLQTFLRPSLIASNHGMFCNVAGWNIGWDFHNLCESRPFEKLPGDYIVSWFLKAYTKMAPVFSLLWFVDTHALYLQDDSWKVFMNDAQPTVSGELRFYDPGLLKENNGSPDFRKHMAYYDAAIHRVDAVIAPILDLADDETLIIVCADHGDFMGEFGHWFTHNYAAGPPGADYEKVKEVLRPVPMVISQPVKGNFDRVNLMDMTATIANWTGVDRRDWWVGRPLLDFHERAESIPVIEPIDKVEWVNERLRALGYIE